MTRAEARALATAILGPPPYYSRPGEPPSSSTREYLTTCYVELSKAGGAFVAEDELPGSRLQLLAAQAIAVGTEAAVKASWLAQDAGRAMSWAEVRTEFVAALRYIATAVEDRNKIEEAMADSVPEAIKVDAPSGAE